MSAEEQVAELRQQIELLEQEAVLEARLVELKESGDPEELVRVKHELRAARQARRELTAGTVNPEVIEASAQVEEDR